MHDRIRAKLFLHGAIVIMVGLLVAVPYLCQLWGVLPENPDGERAWRVAHLEGILNGMLLIAIAAGGRFVLLDDRLQRWTSVSLIITAYGNAIASTIAAAFSARGLTPTGPLANVIVFTIYVIGIMAIYVGIALVIFGAWRYVNKNAANHD